ncbi:hypothetical protein AAHE18_16G000900 [Arachis hypogaea]
MEHERQEGPSSSVLTRMRNPGTLTPTLPRQTDDWRSRPAPSPCRTTTTTGGSRASPPAAVARPATPVLQTEPRVSFNVIRLVKRRLKYWLSCIFVFLGPPTRPML